ncbi:MAG: hypothetical protein ACJA0P_001304 [Planctomycetota bacterium]|jgi:hypothetical protein
MNLRLSAVAPLAIAVTLFGGTAVSRALSSTSPSAAQTQEGGQDSDKGEKHDHDDDDHHAGEGHELHDSMEAMQRNMKALRKVLGKPEQKAEAIAMCLEMEAATMTGFINAPDSPDGLEGSELLAYKADFKKRMLTVAGILVDLELALDQEDTDQAKVLYRSLGASKKEGHSIYIKD